VEADEVGGIWKRKESRRIIMKWGERMRSRSKSLRIVLKQKGEKGGGMRRGRARG